jgi:prepilin-type processing-associated H-X9-DG protein
MLSDSTEGIRNGALWRYTGNERIYRCPSDKSLWHYPDGARLSPRPFNVALSDKLNGSYDERGGGKVYQQSHPIVGFVVEAVTEVRQPANVFSFLDEEAKTVTSGGWFASENVENWWTVPGARDRACGANVAFIDGHVIFKKWNYTGRTRTGPDTFLRNVQDRMDFKWIQSRLPGSNAQ